MFVYLCVRVQFQLCGCLDDLESSPDFQLLTLFSRFIGAIPSAPHTIVTTVTFMSHLFSDFCQDTGICIL